MSIELKECRCGGKKIRTYNKFRRNLIKGQIKSMPMHREWRAEITTFKVEKFLMSRLGRPVDKIFSEFVKEAKKHNLKRPIKDLFFNTLRRYDNYGYGFYISNGILNFRKRHLEEKIPKKFLKYNKQKYIHAKRVIENWLIKGPMSIGRMWVKVRGNYMLLPVSVIIADKWEAKDRTCRIDQYNYEDLQQLNEYVECDVLGYGTVTVDKLSYTSPFSFGGCSLVPIVHIVRLWDIENYKK